MPTILAALFAAFLTTGMSSSVSHVLTMVGGCVASLIMAGYAMVHPGSRVHPTFLLCGVGMAILALLSAEANRCVESSTIHVICCYLALLSMGFSGPSLSGFCRKLLLFNNVFLTAWVIYFGFQGDAFEAWKISNPSGAGNLMAAQINMTIPLVIGFIVSASFQGKILWSMLLSANILAVFLVMSRNGIGSLLALLILYLLFNHKRLAVCVLIPTILLAIFPHLITQNPIIRPILVHLRVMDFKPVAPRSLIWDLSAQHIAEHPVFGVGPGKTRVALSILDINHAHNNVIQVALETGIPSALLYLCVVAAMLSLPARAAFRDQRTFLPTLGILAYMSYSLTAGPLVFPSATFMLAACVNEARYPAAQRISQVRPSSRVSILPPPRLAGARI
ncbi:MAG: O-Antigen ligase [Planctomycetota bacterium]